MVLIIEYHNHSRRVRDGDIKEEKSSIQSSDRGNVARLTSQNVKALKKLGYHVKRDFISKVR